MCRGLIQWWQSRTVSAVPVAGWTSSTGEESTTYAGPFSQWSLCDCPTSVLEMVVPLLLTEKNINTVALIGINLYSVLFLFVHSISWMLLLNTPIVAYQKIKHCFFYLYIVCICNVCLCSHFLITTIKQRQGFLSFTHFGLNIHHPFLYFFTLKVSRFRVPSRLLLLSVLSCHVQQLMVGAISADRAAGVHGSRADSPPTVAHSPTPIYVPVFCSSLWVDCFVIACVLCENRFFIWSFVPLCCRTHSTEIQELVWSADSTGQFWNLRFPKQLLNIACYFVFLWRELMFSFLSLYHPHPDRIYSHIMDSAEEMELCQALAAGHSSGSTAGRTRGFSSRLFVGFAPT